jgi:hypothetical protein
MVPNNAGFVLSRSHSTVRPEIVGGRVEYDPLPIVAKY